MCVSDTAANPAPSAGSDAAGRPASGGMSSPLSGDVSHVASMGPSIPMGRNVPWVAGLAGTSTDTKHRGLQSTRVLRWGSTVQWPPRPNNPDVA